VALHTEDPTRLASILLSTSASAEKEADPLKLEVGFAVSLSDEVTAPEPLKEMSSATRLEMKNVADPLRLTVI
jgi:hypothetical protein